MVTLVEERSDVAFCGSGEASAGLPKSVLKTYGPSRISNTFRWIPNQPTSPSLSNSIPHHLSKTSQYLDVTVSRLLTQGLRD